MIKKLHYVWLGGGKIPASVKSSIRTWKKHCPDWEIVRWDETNFDTQRYPWVREAIEQGKYAFAADFIRLFVLYHEGGAYLDTDVDVLRPLDDGVLAHGFVCGVQVPIVESKDEIYNRKSLQTGFLYSEKGHPLPLVALRELYDEGQRHFVHPDGTQETMPVDIRLMSVFIDHFGAVPDDRTQMLHDDIMLYDSHVFATRKSKTRDSYVVHWFDQSWTDAHGIVPLLKRFVKEHLYFIYRTQ